MEVMGAAGGSGGGDDPNINEHLNKGRKSFRRHKTDQTAKLEEFFDENPHPNEKQRREIAEELGLEQRQVKFWFQNKRTQKKTQAERATNNALRAENEKIYNENLIIKEALKNVICSSCGGPVNEDEEHEHSIEQLRTENARLKEEREKMSSLLSRYTEKPMPKIGLESLPIRGSSSRGPLLTSSLGKRPMLLESTPIRGSLSQGRLLGSSLNIGTRSARMNLGVTSLSFQDEDTVSNTISKKVAVAAKEELLKLLSTTEPLWSRSPVDQKLSLHLESYENLFPRTNHFKYSKARVESSKESRIVKIQAMELVDMFLDSEKWASLFPTMMTKAQTIKVIENGSSESRSGALLLMHEEMHVLSPLVPSREFYFLRYCQQVQDSSIWVITDVSIDYMKGNNPHPYCWRFPSGCMIHHISDGWCQVTRVEHVEVDEKIQTPQLYRDLVNSNIAYGAERWLMELQRTCERFARVRAEYIASFDIGGAMTTLGERRNMINLSEQMVKRFYGSLNMSSKINVAPQLTEENGDHIRITVDKITSQSNPMVNVSAATSFWLPFNSQNLFDFFRDPMKRPKWDAMCYQSPVHEVAHISTGTHPSNYISIIQPIDPTTNNAVIIQESSIDPLGSYIVYSSTNILDLKKVMNGEDSSAMPIFPSGIVISGDVQSIANARASSSSGNGDIRARGSLLTVAFQILMPSPTTMALDAVSSVNSVMIETVKSIKDALISDSN